MEVQLSRVENPVSNEDGLQSEQLDRYETNFHSLIYSLLDEIEGIARCAYLPILNNISTLLGNYMSKYQAILSSPAIHNPQSVINIQVRKKPLST